MAKKRVLTVFVRSGRLVSEGAHDGGLEGKGGRRIRSVDIVVVVCSEHTDTATGVFADLSGYGIRLISR